jgi:hypothetical protein
MKRAKKLAPPRNPLVALVVFKKSGVHGKSSKALRRAEKVVAQKLAGEPE